MLVIAGKVATNRLLFLFGQACSPAPLLGVASTPALLWGGLPSLDVHLVGRGAILHLTLAGGACGQEKHKGAEVNGAEDPRACSASTPCSPRRWFHGWLSASQSPGPPHPLISAPSLFAVLSVEPLHRAQAHPCSC